MTSLSVYSRATPAWLLQFNLTFERFGEIDDEKLDEAACQSHTSENIKVSFSPNSNNLDTTWSPDLFRSWRHWLRLNSISTHDIYETRRDVGWVDATAVWNTTSFHWWWRAVEILILRPIQKTSRWQSTAIELLLNKVDEVLKVRVVSI